MSADANSEALIAQWLARLDAAAEEADWRIVDDVRLAMRERRLAWAPKPVPADVTPDAYEHCVKCGEAIRARPWFVMRAACGCPRGESPTFAPVEEHRDE